VSSLNFAQNFTETRERPTYVIFGEQMLIYGSTNHKAKPKLRQF